MVTEAEAYLRNTQDLASIYNLTQNFYGPADPAAVGEATQDIIANPCRALAGPPLDRKHGAYLSRPRSWW